MPFTEALKEKWENFKFWLEEHNIPIPLFFILVILAIVALAYFLITMFLPTEEVYYSLKITVLDRQNQPISNATVTIKSEFFKEKTEKTDSRGRASFELPAKKEFTAIATYQEKSASLKMSLESDREEKIVLPIEIVTYADKKVIFYKGETSEKATEIKDFSAYCSKAEWNKNLLASGGEATLEKIPSDCGTLTLRIGSEIYTTTDVSARPFEVRVKSIATKGSILAIIKSLETGLAVGAGEVSVSLINEFGITIEGPLPSSAAGSVTFTDIEPGKYAVSVSGAGKYKSTTSEYKELKGAGQVIFDVSLQPAEKVYNIKVRVSDTKSQPVKAMLELRDLSNNIIVQSRYADDKGEYTFKVDENKSYNLIVKVGEWVENFNVRPSESFYDITYDESKLSKCATLFVYVKDSEEKALEKAKVEIFKKSNESAGLQCSTGADGKCEFYNLPEGLYYAKASFANYPPVQSGIFEAKANMQKPIEVVIKIEIPKAQFEFVVYGENDERLQSVNITAYDSASSNILGESKTDTNGVGKISVLAGLKPYFVIDAEDSDYLPYITMPMSAIFGIKTTREIRLVRGKTLKIIFDGLKSQDGNAEKTLSAGSAYNAKFRLIVPNKGYTSAGIFVISGNDISGKTNLMEEDTTYLGGIKTSATRISRGTSYTPPTGTATDLESATNENAKWVEMEWSLSRLGVSGGVFEAEVEYFVKEGISAGELAKIGYRGYAQADSVDRDPKDNILGNKKNSPEKHALYAATYSLVYSVGETNLCDGKFCKSFSIEDIQRRTKSFVTDTYSAQLNSNYRLSFVINRQAGSSGNATLRIFDEQRAFSYGKYEVIIPDGSEQKGTAEKELLVNLGSFRQNSSVSGTLQFSTLKEGDIPLKILIEDASGIVFEHVITIKVAPARELSLDVVPKILIALVDNEVLFRFTDKNTGEPESNVSVTLYLDDKIIASGITDYDGVLPYKIESPSAGSVLKVVGRKTGFRKLVQEIKIESSALKLTPPTLDLELQPESREEAELIFRIENQAPFKLKIGAISIDGLEDLVVVGDISSYIGKEIAPSKSLDVKLKAKLSDKGKNIDVTKELLGAISVTTESSSPAKEWTGSIELRVRIKLGSALDSIKCLAVEPSSWEIKSYGEQKKLTLTIKNNCTVQGIPVPLKELNAKVRWLGESAIGNFQISGDDLETTEIETQWTTISDSLAKSEEREFILFFNPSAQLTSANAQPKIEFSANYYSDKGIDKPKATMNISISVNNLLKCLQIVRPQGIELKTCGFDTGWGLNTKYFDRDPYEAAQQQQYFAWPTVQYIPPWQTSAQGQSTQWKCTSDSADIIIDNSCAQDVDITVQADSGLIAKPTSLKVNANSSKSFKIEPATAKGQFNVKVLAKFSSSSKRAEEIDNFAVKVVRHDEMLEECLPIIEPRTLRANFLGWQHTVAKIYNKCYHLGYALSQLKLSNIHCYSPSSKGTSLEGPCPMIKNMVIANTETKKVSEREEWEIMEVHLWFDPSIKEVNPIDFEGSAEEVIGNIRVIATDQYMAAVSPGIISVPMKVPMLGEKYFPVSVTFENPLAWLGLLGGLLNKGSDKLEPAQCINPNALIVPEPLTDDHFVDDLFIWKESPPVTELVLPYARSNEEVNPSGEGGRAFCGKDDYISNVGFNSWEDPKSGVRLYFELTNDKHHIVMKVDRSKMITECARINIELPIKVTRVYYKKGTQEVKLKVSVNVLNKGISQLSDGCENRAARLNVMPSWGVIKPCDGEDKYEKYGFDRLLFTWRTDDITTKTCEPEPKGDGYFCDGAQFVMQTAAKIRKINQRVSEINTRLPAEYQAAVSVIGKSPELVQEINSSEGKLYKIFKSQFILRDDVSNSSALVFVSKEGLLLGQPPLPQEACSASHIETTLSNIIKAPQNELGAIDAMNISFAQFEALLAKCYGNDIGMGNAVALTSKEIDYISDVQNIWSNIRKVADEIKLPRQNAYALTFSEYLTIHEQLTAGVKANIVQKNRSAPITVNIGQTSITATEQEWTKFLLEYSKRTTFMLVVMNKPGLSQAMEEYIRIRAQDILGKTEEESLIASAEAYLKTDNLSRALIEDLDKGNETLKMLGLKVDQLEFKRYEDINFKDEISQKRTECGVVSGKYFYRIEPKIAIDYASNPPKIIVMQYIVKLALTESLEAIDKRKGTKFSENPLMYMSFDGEIGKESVGANYGVGITLAGAVPSELFYNEHGERIYPRKPGVAPLSFSYNGKFEKSRTGVLVSIDLKSKKMEYIPSYPFMLRIISKNEGQNVVYYRLSNREYYGDIKELFVWHQPSESNTEGTEAKPFSVDSFGMQEPDSFCSGWSQKTEAAKLIIGQGAWFAMSYVPSRAANEYLKLELICAKNPVVLSTVTYEGQEYSTSESRGVEGGTVRIIDTARQPSLKEYIEKIETGEICIENISRTQLKLRWNPAIFG
ncbi:MAG: Ig-like domain-containing protein [Candidatus Diapherotrites archaeon]|nr:Ig-like domain-containing protein [Candidatus Diapherotrites archaeon]